MEHDLDLALAEQAAALLDISLTSEQRAQLTRYRELLLSWNSKHNLTAVRTAEGINTRHFLDSLSCVLATGSLEKSRLIDVGTGAGFPGLPLKIIFPSMQLTLVESVQKKCHFLQAVVDDLQLNDVKVIPERAELLGRQKQHRAKYDWAVARAVAELRILAEYLLPLCRVDGYVLAQKGLTSADEVADANDALSVLGGVVEEVVTVPEIEEGYSRYLVKIKKVGVTPDKYPRRVGIPQKRPL